MMSRIKIPPELHENRSELRFIVQAKHVILLTNLKVLNFYAIIEAILILYLSFF